MVLVATLYAAFLLVGATITAGVGLHTWRNNDSLQGRLFTGVTAGIVVYVLGKVIELLFRTRAASVFGSRLIYVGVVVGVLFLFLFTMAFTDREHVVTPRVVALLAIEPAVVVLLAFTSGSHDLFWVSVTDAPGTVTGVAYETGPVIYAHALYSYLLLTVATVLLARQFFRSQSLYRWQILTFVTAVSLPWLLNVAFFAGKLLGTDAPDFTPAGFVFTALALWAATARYDFVDVTPVARETVVDNIENAVFVFDDDDRFIDVNPAATALVGRDEDALIGRSATEALADSPAFDVYERYADVTDVREAVSLEVDGEVRHFEVTVTPLQNKRAAVVGRLFVFRDVTAQRERRRELERQNDQLEDFASIVSHDLRNPLNVAQGHASMVAEHVDPAGERHVEEVEHSLDRMRRLVDDVLTMARQGQTLTDTEPVPLGDLADRAWRTVDTADATLVNALDRTVSGDPDRLRQVFENCFRNALDHGPADVTVTVGSIGDDREGAFVDPAEVGFFVADDGPGIPPDERESVLDAGFTTHDDGTGLGLAIVESFVEAHGWRLAVAASEDAGARLEFTGVTWTSP